MLASTQDVRISGRLPRYSVGVQIRRYVGSRRSAGCRATVTAKDRIAASLITNMKEVSHAAKHDVNAFGM